MEGRPSEGAAANSPPDMTAAVCSFCGQKTPHMFGGDAPGAQDAWICEKCLDLFHDSLSRQREQEGPEGAGTDAK